MSRTRVLISGASIAGPALALWLQRYGFEVTVVEKAPALRPGGQAVDFKGSVHRSVLQRMGIYDEVLDHQTGGGGDGVIVDAQGRRLAVVPNEFSAGEIEIARGDLARIVHDRTADTCEYLFGDSIATIEQSAGGVDVRFEHAPPRRFDLVVGADGIHSHVRRLVFGPESDYVRHLGYYYALVDLPPGELTRGDEMYGEPGRMAATGGTKAPAFFVFASPRTDLGRADVETQQRFLVEHYRGAGWKVPALLEQLPSARSFYLDSIARATVDHYAEGRVVLLGDAAFGNTLGGFGTGLALVGAYVLAGELHRAGGDHTAAFPRFEERFRDYAKVADRVNAGRILAPRTRLGMRARNLLFSASFLVTPMLRLMDRFATDIELPDYEVHPVG